MPSGFTTRTKGRASFGVLYPLQEVTQKINVGAAGASTAADPAGLTIIASTLGTGVVTLGPPEPAQYKTIAVTTQSSGAVVVKTNSTGVTFFDGVNSFWKASTTTGTVAVLHLMGVSTAQWSVLSVNSNSTTTANIPAGLGTSS